MTLDRYIEQKFPIRCRGQDLLGNDVLKHPVEVTLTIYQRYGDERGISSRVNYCPYNTGGHGQRCKASHPEIDKLIVSGKVLDAFCPYSFDLPYALKKKTLKP